MFEWDWKVEIVLASNERDVSRIPGAHLSLFLKQS